MSLESFYGGKQGVSPVIRNKFQYVTARQTNGRYEDPAYGAAIAAAGSDSEKIAAIKAATMDEAFADSSYEDVWYNELCIIDTKNKNNPNNGKLYRRTLKGRGDINLKNRSAEYIGQIVGPAGTNPVLSFGTLENVNAKAHGEYAVNDDITIAWPSDENNISHVKPDNGVNPHVFNGTVGSMLVPGKYTENNQDKFNDNIKYSWFNIVDNTTETPTQSIVYLGFQIPYPYFDITTTHIDWIENGSSLKTGDDEHPFYHTWNFNLPRGTRGNAAGNIRLRQWKDFSNLSVGGDSLTKPFLYDFVKDVVKDSVRGAYHIATNPIGPDIANVTSEKKQLMADSYIWVYDYTFYDKIQGSEATINGKKISETTPVFTFYLGNYNEIKNIEFADDGTLTFIYTNTEEKEFSQKVQWVKEINITDDGKITFIYNTFDDENNLNQYGPIQLPYPTGINISNQGTISVSFADNNNLPVEINGSLFDINYVKTLLMDNDTKVLTYTNYPKGESIELNDGEGINYIKAMTVDDRYHLMVYYGSTQFRVTQADVNAGSKDGFAITQTAQSDNTTVAIWKNQTFKNGIVYPNISATEYWQDLGRMREIKSGIRVVEEFDFTNHPNKSDLHSYTISQFISEVLNPQYWDNEQTIENPYYQGQMGNETDYNGDPLRGNFAYTTEIDGGSAYYYDYDNHSWKYAGSWGASSSKIELNIKLNNNDYVRDATLENDGVLFLEKSTHTPVSNPLPIIWKLKEN